MSSVVQNHWSILLRPFDTTCIVGPWLVELVSGRDLTIQRVLKPAPAGSNPGRGNLIRARILIPDPVRFRRSPCPNGFEPLPVD
jgi:hypothetical protein